MIEYISGNLLDADCRIIAHGCNAQGVMGSGVANAIKDKWPNVFVEYHNTYDTIGLSLGDVVWSISHSWTERQNPFYNEKDLRWIANCITQEHYGKDGRRYVNYGAIAKCFHEVSIIAEEHGERQIAIPKIGAGLGGGDWVIIAEIIETYFKDKIVKVYEL